MGDRFKPFLGVVVKENLQNISENCSDRGVHFYVLWCERHYPTSPGSLFFVPSELAR